MFDKFKAAVIKSALPFILGMFAAALLLTCSCTSPSYSTMPTTSEPGIYMLTITMPDGSKGGCTAFKVAEDRLATAGHCDQHDPLVVYTIDDVVVTPVYTDEDKDVSIFRGSLRGAVILVAPMDPAIGEQVWTRGFPHMQLFISTGYWSGRDEDGQGRVSVSIAGGASGSPLLNVRGECVGIIVSAYRGGDSLGFVATIDSLQEALLKSRVM